ncbi:MAG: L-rhamnose mutarotase [Chloroflexi bacterium]|nr:L-rhamnose mutarotase [Chloroflexota bacterium]
MGRFAFTFELRPDAVAEYERRHRELPPELVALTRSSGIRNYSIHLRGTTVFGYFEADDPEAAIAAGADHPVVVAWQAAIAELRADPVDAAPPLREIMYLE